GQALRLVERFSALGTRDQRDVVGRVNAESTLATSDVNATASPLHDARDRRTPTPTQPWSTPSLCRSRAGWASICSRRWRAARGASA
ncbi:hypothetical protein, partial [Burkholderia pseudomallei]